ncbi:hypothetical protein [Dysgonomonas macrotermitis]|uniref:Uncharacterized protein n=1 Tax=Dysgonomonas macrotermitis TaxID=1346286 RepID=A0A1M4W3X8_9BACT|nr:hypothetical protein [Dysgonomonas macrotermitis]SHE76004.1 hypothetical protein SAMN05444362_102121 [Dysgonomonas macrotermitis]
MNAFSNIKELLSVLARERTLLTEMFEKRKTFSYKYDYALELVEYDDSRIRFLIDYSVIRENGNFLEIDDQFIQFFEQILEVNEEINTSLIDSNIQHLKDNINYYFKENNEHRKYSYLRTIKSSLRKMGILTLRNVVDLKRNIDNTFKNEPNYKIKKAKLESLDKKRDNLSLFIQSIEKLINEEDEQTFFKTALDDELLHIIHHLKIQLNECNHNIISVQQQILEYLNQVQYQSRIVEKVRQLKYLKDQFTIRNDTDMERVLAANKNLIFEKRKFYPLKLSLDYLGNDEVLESIRKANAKQHSKVKQKVSLAPALPSDLLKEETEIEIQINLEEVKNSFIASGNNLFNFVIRYPYEKELSFDEQVTVFCQLISLYEEEFEFTNDFSIMNEIEYAIVYPK